MAADIEPKPRAAVSMAGVFRCCSSGIPIDGAGYVVVGDADLEHAPCERCTVDDGRNREGQRSGMVFIAARRLWMPAWVYDERGAPTFEEAHGDG